MVTGVAPESPFRVIVTPYTITPGRRVHDIRTEVLPVATTFTPFGGGITEDNQKINVKLGETKPFILTHDEYVRPR